MARRNASSSSPMSRRHSTLEAMVKASLEVFLLLELTECKGIEAVSSGSLSSRGVLGDNES